MTRSARRSWSDHLANIAVIACAFVVIAAIARRELRPVPTDQSVRAIEPAGARRIEEWPRVVAAAREPHDPTALVTVATFLDVECPYCRQFEEELLRWKTRVGSTTSILTLHFPLRQHRFARPGARALECARNQGRFTPMLAQLLHLQDSLGLLTWATIAGRAGVQNSTAFDACILQTGPIPGVDEGLALGHAIGIAGTPAVLVNGVLFPKPPSMRTLDSILGLAVARPRVTGR